MAVPCGHHSLWVTAEVATKVLVTSQSSLANNQQVLPKSESESEGEGGASGKAF
jgi:hypothetical protein